MEDGEGIKALALRAVLDCENQNLLDLIYRILLEDKIEGRAD